MKLSSLNRIMMEADPLLVPDEREGDDSQKVVDDSEIQKDIRDIIDNDIEIITEGIDKVEELNYFKSVISRYKEVTPQAFELICNHVDSFKNSGIIAIGSEALLTTSNNSKFKNNLIVALEEEQKNIVTRTYERIKEMLAKLWEWIKSLFRSEDTLNKELDETLKMAEEVSSKMKENTEESNKVKEKIKDEVIKTKLYKIDVPEISSVLNELKTALSKVYDIDYKNLSKGDLDEYQNNHLFTYDYIDRTLKPIEITNVLEYSEFLLNSDVYIKDIKNIFYTDTSSIKKIEIKLEELNQYINNTRPDELSTYVTSYFTTLAQLFNCYRKIISAVAKHVGQVKAACRVVVL